MVPLGLSAALARLPAVHSAAMRLHLAGATTSELSDALGVDEAAVGPLLVVADLKLRELLVGDYEETAPDEAADVADASGDPGEKGL